MAREPRNVAASVRARLQNLARETRANFQRVLTRYALERLLFRLSVSPHRERFVLKGAMLYAAWLDDPFRTTRDLDLLAFGERDAERLVTIFHEVCVQPVAEDGLVFDAEHLAAEAIRDNRAYGGLRLRTSARLAAAAIPVRIDIGFGDAVTPGPLALEYPALLNQPAPRLKGYPRETVVAEKFEAIVALDLANSRMKDFYDLLAMSRLFVFEGAVLAAAIRATFERRGTKIPSERPPSLTRTFSVDPRKMQQWRSFLAREPLLIDEPDLSAVVREVGDFTMPAAHAAIEGRRMLARWGPDEGWRPASWIKSARHAPCPGPT